MKIIEVHKAQAFPQAEEVESITLSILSEVPEQKSSEDSAVFYKSEAKLIMRALSVLPQGTKYQLLCMLLESAPTMYRGK